MHRFRFLARIFSVNALFIATVLIPTILAVIYYGLIASNVYLSESRFLVRSPERQSSPLLGIILRTAGFSRAEDDAFAVQSFILSRDAVQTLDRELHIKQHYSAENVDLFNRFPGLDWDRSFENFHRYYQKHIEIQLEPATSIATLTVRAFSPKDAHAINLNLLQHAEELINKLNERGRQDLIRYATKEVMDLERKAKDAALALADYRNDWNVIDPEKQSTIPMQQIANLQEKLLIAKSQILQIENVSRTNPQLPVLRQQAALLEREIHTVSLRVTGGGQFSLAGKAAKFQRLTLDREFADKMLASAMTSLEQARSDAQRQQLYLERIAQPSLPDEALEPRRVRYTLSTLLFGLICWGILTLLVAGTREHMD
jgi:capsular polysaccharide transport system permease protein